MDYIDRIKALREDNDMTQIELSKQLGLSGSTYGLYETRRRQMDIETFVKICKIFNVESNDLLDI